MSKDLHTPENQSLIEFPCDFELKAMGKNSDKFIEIVFDITKQFAPNINKENIRINNSKTKKFISVNIKFHATCIEQVHAIYGELKQHPKVLMTL